VSFGIECWDGNGNKTLDQNSIVSRQVYANVVAAGSSGSVDLPDIAGKEAIYFSYATSGGDALAHTVSRSGTIISWSPRSSSQNSSSNSLILVFVSL